MPQYPLYVQHALRQSLNSKRVSFLARLPSIVGASPTLFNSVKCDLTIYNIRVSMLNSVKIQTNFACVHSPASQSYRTLDQYNIVEKHIDGYPVNLVLEVKEKSSGKECFLSLRHGEYCAQVDKACSDIYRIFVPSTPQTWIVKNNNDFYLASDTIMNLTDYVNLSEESDNFLPRNFGTNSVLSHFLGETDIHQGNMLISTEDETIFDSYKIDSAESLNADALQSDQLKSESESDSDELNDLEGVPVFKVDDYYPKPYEPKTTLPAFSIEDVFQNYWKFPKAVVKHYQYQSEQHATLKAIASIPFKEIADILRNTVTASAKTENLAFIEKLHQHDFFGKSLDVQNKVKAILMHPDQFPKKCEIEDVIQLLEKRHQRYSTLAKSF